MLPSLRYLPFRCPAILAHPKKTSMTTSGPTGLGAHSMESYARQEAKQVSPAAERNKQPILEVLQQHLPPAGLIVEVASGSGQHAAYFAAALPGLTFLPTDYTKEGFESIAAYTAGLPNVLQPCLLDVTQQAWPVPQEVNGIICTNMCHISPFAATQGLFRGAGE